MGTRSFLVLFVVVCGSLSEVINAEPQRRLWRLPGDGLNGAPLRYRSTTDGTTTDLNTGLIWGVEAGWYRHSRCAPHVHLEHDGNSP